MLEKPDLPDETLQACVREEYGLPLREVVFLPLGADQRTAVYRAVADDGTLYFLKLRSGGFDEATVAVPYWLHTQGIGAVIPPLATRAGRLWTPVDTFVAMLYPFVEGRDGWGVDLSEGQWMALGAALRGLHTADLPPALRQNIPQETYTPHWRALVRTFLARADTPFTDPLAAAAAAVLRTHRAAITTLVERADQLAGVVQARALAPVLCHADIHAGNILLGAADTLYVVDWDTLCLAPKERDLMFIGAGIGGGWRTACAAAAFYSGYGPAVVDAEAIAYYRYERIVQDLAVGSEQLLGTEVGGANRAEEFDILVSQFRPGSVLDIAFATDPQQPA